MEHAVLATQYVRVPPDRYLLRYRLLPRRVDVVERARSEKQQLIAPHQSAAKRGHRPALPPVYPVFDELARVAVLSAVRPERLLVDAKRNPVLSRGCTVSITWYGMLWHMSWRLRRRLP